jgi:Ca-activated chloride channel family protein
MRFLHPQFAVWIAAAFALVAIARWPARRLFDASTTVASVDRRSRASLLRRLPLFALALVLALAACALLDPVLPYAETEVQSRGLDIVVVLDLSSSMQEPMERTPPLRNLANLTFTNRDAAMTRVPQGKTRLEATKDAVKTFVSHRRDDRIGLVVFSDNPYVISPLTFDHDYLIRYVDLVDDQILRGEGMTAIGDGLALANVLLARQAPPNERRNRVIVLFTDGENNRGRDPVEVLKECDDAAIHVHMVGVDLEDEVRIKRDVQRLVSTIRGNGGSYFDANTVRDLDTASRAIDGLEKGYLTSKAYVRDAPVYEWFALPALIGLALVMALESIPYFIDQT